MDSSTSIPTLSQSRYYSGPKMGLLPQMLLPLLQQSSEYRLGARARVQDGWQPGLGMDRSVDKAESRPLGCAGHINTCRAGVASGQSMELAVSGGCGGAPPKHRDGPGRAGGWRVGAGEEQSYRGWVAV